MAFDEAGQAEGLQIWRIEDFAPVPYSTGKLGKFHTGDSYIVLDTKDFGGKLKWNVHFWLGNETTQDEAGAAAMLTVELDDVLGGVPVQYRETEGNESAKFLSYFPKGLRYLPGGVKSGFKHYDPDEVEKRMFIVKGKRNVRVQEVAVSVESMNRSDCFILDCGKGKSILVFMPPGARKMEKFKANQVANEIRDEDHAGDSEVEIVDEYSDNMEKFFMELGSGSWDEVAEVAEDDEQADLQHKQQTKLYVLRDGSFEEVSAPPLKQEMLDKTDVFLLTGGRSQVYLWIGQAASKEEKVTAMSAGEAFLRDGSFSKNVQLVRVLEGLETAVFKQFFNVWNELDEDSQFSDSRVAEWKIDDLHTENRRRVERAGGTAPGFLPDDGTGEKTIWRVEDMELQPVDNQDFLFGGDSYVILYKYAAGSILYYWQGSKSTTDERAASALHTVRIDNEELDGQAIQIRVVQGQEPRHFLRMFGGQLVIFAGGKASGFNNVNDRDEYDEDGVRLYRVRCLSKDARDSRAEQVEEKSTSLSSDDVFILESKDTCWIWRGKESSEEEFQVAEKFFATLCPGRESTELAEGSEDDAFWDVLGGQEEYGPPEYRPVFPPRLFHVQKMISGRTRLIELFDFKKDDLVEDDVMILDTGREVFVWVGEKSDSNEKEAAMKMAEEYLDTDPSFRNSTNTVILLCKQGLEPDLFGQFFPDW